MATKLIDLIEIVENNADFILLEVTGDKKSCILSGVLDGNEELIRVTKGEDHVLTIYFKDGRHFSYDFGLSGYTLISNKEENRRNAIVEVIKNDLETSLTDTTGFNLPQKKADVKGRKTTFKIMNGNCIHKNGQFYKHVQNTSEIMEEINKNYKNIKEVDNYTSQNGCKVKVLTGIRR